MANNKYHYYVLVLSAEGGACYVTDAQYGNKMAHWDKNKVPMEFGKYQAEDISFGLTVNGHLAVAVMSRYEIDSQPYYYERGHFEWVVDKKESEDKKDAEI